MLVFGFYVILKLEISSVSVWLRLQTCGNLTHHNNRADQHMVILLFGSASCPCCSIISRDISRYNHLQSIYNPRDDDCACGLVVRFLVSIDEFFDVTLCFLLLVCHSQGIHNV